MGSINPLFEFSEKICYVQCGFCTTILLVSVPSSSQSMVVTVRCGHCSSLLSVNMMKASFIPLHLLASLSHDEAKAEHPTDQAGTRKNPERRSPSVVTSNSDNEDEDLISVNRTVNKPPEKRQRAPSAYNRFIKEEIRRLKAQNPNMAHKEAFSQAAKNWAHFPPNQNKGDGDQSCLGQESGKNTCISNATDQVLGEGKGFRERKVPRHFIWEKTPFD
ncbi:axial regulator YABBY 4 isoform X2 [Punica granatum]|uniref:Axial regulator YABBY 4 isoform X2 n=1 Tax=Punica granatum TaxID=22663 RepID=A0A6P8CWI2_PUNGR|nr:axial regulator YABBY 4 isoform X2 [Punica granatum]